MLGKRAPSVHGSLIFKKGNRQELVGVAHALKALNADKAFNLLYHRAHSRGYI
jgi:hypothetical protein